MLNLLLTPAGRECPICLQARPANTLFLGHAPVTSQLPLPEDAEHPPIPVRLIQAGEAEVDDRIHLICEHCIWTPQNNERFPNYPAIPNCPSCRRPLWRLF